MALKATVQCGAGERWDGRLQSTEDVVERKVGLHPEGDDGGFFQRREGCALALACPMGKSSTLSRPRHLATVLGFTPWHRGSVATGSREFWNSALVLAVVVALPCRSCAIVPPFGVGRTLHHDTLGLHT